MKSPDDGVLAHLGIDSSALIGRGAEARVYAMGDDRIARVVDPRTGVEQLPRLAAFYRTPDRDRCPPPLPPPPERAEVSRRPYPIERRLAGSGMTQG